MNSNNILKGFSAVLLATAIVGCSDNDEETKNSSDFATSAIEANYSVEVSESNKVIFQANFVNDKNSLELENGDVISIISDGEAIALEESISFGVATYSLVRTEKDPNDGGNYFFEFTRTSQEDADNSFVKVPEGFILVSPTDGVDNYEPGNGESFAIAWRQSDSSEFTPDSKEEFTLRYDFTCRNDSGTPSISKSVVEKVEDDGAHVVDLASILGAGDYDACSRFDIIAIRSTLDGVLDSELKSGSVTGLQVRTVEGSLDGLQLQ